MIWQQTISPVVGEPTLYKAVWSDYKMVFSRLGCYTARLFFNTI